MTVEQLINALDEMIPKTLSEPWDNDGIDVVPDKNSEITGVLCALDCTSIAINRATELGCNVIITHHPLVFKPLGAVSCDDSVGKRVIECIRRGIAVVSFHTRLDIIEGGVNDILAETVGLTNVESFIPYGRIGDIEETKFEVFAESVANALGLNIYELGLVKSSENVKRVALVSGCGKDEIGDAIKAGADTFITGEVMHNHMLDCREMGINLICATHYATERIVLSFLAEKVKEFARVEVLEFTREEEYGI
ncbi:MAG: Nif3-like dinuclear metal center hexameric protein [Clostridia bacterium]|nr:Nif3-like dinuclear metal center hexameric protein [Clostridia bacterium]